MRLVLPTLMLHCAVAAAHPRFTPGGTDRHVKLSFVDRGELRVSYGILVGELPAGPLRLAADLDRSGLLDDAEQRLLAERFAGLVRDSFTLEVDGRRQRLAWEATPGFSTDRRAASVPFSVDLVAWLTVPEGEHVLRVDDGANLPSPAETEIVLEERGPHVRLLGAWRGAEGRGLATRFAFSGPRFSVLEDRSVGLRYAGRWSRRRMRPWPLAIGGVLVGAGIAALLARRRRRASGA